MRVAPSVIPFFTDQNVPDSVGGVIQDAGHDLTRLRDVMDQRTPDPVIAVACASSGNVLVSHDGDFRQLSKRLQITQRQYRESLHRIDMRCYEPNSASRFGQSLPVIELEWSLLVPGRPMVVEIRDTSIKIHR